MNTQTNSSPPNILLITTDQQRWDTIHAAGNGSIFTPHLNWLHDTGIHFSRAYTDCPVCMPARATIMTGMPGYRHGAVGNTHSEPMRGRTTLPEILTRAGYETRAQGKMHFHPMRKKFGFETMELSHDYYRRQLQTDPDRMGARHGVGQNEMEPVIGSVDENHTLTRWVINRSIDFLETRDEERPFFLWTSISKPHPPFDPSRKFWDLYREMEMPEAIRGDWSESWEHIPPGFLQPTAHLNNVYRFSPQQLENIRRAYYACITEIDTNLGLLFTALRELGLFENTLILFTSDHGEMLGDHNMGGKSTFLEGSAHIPLIMRPPGEWDQEPSRGTVCDSLVTLQDILPTCLEAAGLTGQLPEWANGRSLMGLPKGAPGRERIFGQCGDIFGVIEQDWKYLCLNDGESELLFNLAKDPEERVNRAKEEAGRCRRMQAALVEELEAAGSEAVADGQLVRKAPKSVEDVRRWSLWPGFHRNDSETDLLH